MKKVSEEVFGIPLHGTDEQVYVVLTDKDVDAAADILLDRHAGKMRAGSYEFHKEHAKETVVLMFRSWELNR